MIFLLLTPVVLGALLVGLQFGWRWVLAPLLGLLILRWAVVTLRSMAHSPGATGSQPEPVPITASERTLYWCEMCGVELLVVTKGAGAAPRHCGQKMHERTELVGAN